MKAQETTILYMAGSTGDEGRFVGKKTQRIEDRLLQGSKREKFKFVPKLDVGIHNVQRMLLELKDKYRSEYIVHFDASGTEDGKIALANEAGSRQMVSGSAVVELLKVLKKDGIRAVILDGSHTEQLGQQLKGFIDYVVSIKGAMDSDSAVIFFTHFYQGLFWGRDFDTAFKLGKNQLLFQKPADYNKPILHEPKVFEAVRQPLEKKSVKYLDRNRKICAASSV